MDPQPQRKSRDAVKDIWGPRTPYKHVWPTRVDDLCIEEPEKWVQSACVLCSNGCGMDIGVKNDKIVAVRGRATDRVNHGRLGPKGMNGWTSMNHPDRLKYPQIRKHGKLQRASWDEAMDLIVKKAQDVRERLTAHGIGFYTSGQLFLEEYYALAMVGKAGLCTLHMDGNTRLCTATAAAAMRESFGCDGQPGSYRDIDYTQCILMVGHNMAATQTVLWARVLDRLAGPDPPELIVIDPRQSATAKEATVHLAPRIGTNLALLNGIQHILIREHWIDQRYLDKHVVGLEILKETVKSSTPAKTEQITGVPATEIERAARIIAKSDSLFSTCLQGVYQSNQATASACAVNNINLLRGAIGRPGSGVLQMNGQPTAQNNREAGCDGEFPGFRNYNNPNHMRELADIWNVDYTCLPHWNQPTHIQNMLNYIAAGTMEMFWISGTNPLVSLPNLARVRKLLTQPNMFVVVQDIFPTETTAIADVVLPAAGWGEKTGCFTNVDRTVHISYKAVDPPGEARSDLEIFVDFSNRMQFKDKDGSPLIPWNTPEGGFEAFKKLTKGRPCDYSGMTYEKLTGGSGIQWPCTEDRPSGTERLFEDGIFYTATEYCESFGHDLETGAPYSKPQYEAINPDGRAILKACHYIPSQEQPSEEYPIQLSTGRLAHHFHTRTKTGRSKPLQDAAPAPTITISSHDAQNLAIVDGEEAIIRSERGEVQMRVTIDEIAPKQAFIPFHYGYWDAPDGKGRAANELTQDQWDPVSKQPQFKGGAIRIEKCGSGNHVYAAEKQTDAIKKVESGRATAAATHNDSRPRKRHISLWLGATEEFIKLFANMCEDQIPHQIHDLEVVGGLRILYRISTTVLENMQPMITKYHCNAEYGKKVSEALRDTVFPQQYGEAVSDAYRTLVTLQGLMVFLASVSGHLQALNPASQALWDPDLQAVVQQATTSMDRCEAWIRHQITVRGPQTLIVPSHTIE